MLFRSSKEFFEFIKNPPECQIRAASELLEKERANGSNLKNVTIMKLGERGYGGYYREREMVWKESGKADQFDTAQTYYYLPLKGFSVETSDVDIPNMQHFSGMVVDSGIPGLHGITIYGVRKSDIEFIKTQKNWVNVQTHIRAVLAKLDHSVVKQCALKEIDANKYFRYNNDIAKLLPGNTSPDRKSTRLNSSHTDISRMPSSA